MTNDTRANLPATIRAAILEVAADLEPADLDDLDDDVDFRDELDLDSMDFLNVLIAIKAATGVEIPETDYPELRTLASLRAYLERRVQGP